MADGSYIVSGRTRPLGFLDVAEVGVAIAMPVLGLVFYTGWHLPLFLCQVHLWRGLYGGETQHEGRRGDWVLMALDLAVAALQYVLWSGFWSRPELDVIVDPYRTKEYIKMSLIGTMFLISALRCLGVGDWWYAGGQLDFIARRGGQGRGGFTKSNRSSYSQPQMGQQQQQTPSTQVLLVQPSNPTPAYAPGPLVSRGPYAGGYPPYYGPGPWG